MIDIIKNLVTVEVITQGKTLEINQRQVDFIEVENEKVNIVEVVQRGLQGASGDLNGGSGNSYFPSGW